MPDVVFAKTVVVFVLFVLRSCKVQKNLVEKYGLVDPVVFC